MSDESLHYWLHVKADVEYFFVVVVHRVVNFMFTNWQAVLAVVIFLTLLFFLQCYRLYKYFKEYSPQNMLL